MEWCRRRRDDAAKGDERRDGELELTLGERFPGQEIVQILIAAVADQDGPEPACRIPCRFHSSSVVVSNRLSSVGSGRSRSGRIRNS